MDKILEFMNTPYYWLLIGFVLLLEIYLNSKVNIIIGKAGEFYAKGELKKLPKENYVILNDLMFEADGRTCQIDHIVVSIYGVFVIETKQYNGYIRGSKYDKKWVRKGKNRDIYYTNPIRQNYGHIKTICSLFKLDESYVYNIVYIPSTAMLDIKHDGEVVLSEQLCSKILSHTEIKLDNIDRIVQMMKQCNIVDKRKRKEHIKYLKMNMEKMDNMKCPKCGGGLRVINGIYGKFISCSNYPKCDYKNNIK